MGRSAGQSARVEGADGPRSAAPRPAASRPAAPRPAAPRPAASRPAAPAHTVREILPPWHLIEGQAAQESENAQWLTDDAVEEVGPPPSSGVRMSDPRLGVATPIPDSLLTFKVYTLAELESRDAPSSLRLSQAGLDSAPARRHARAVLRWQSVYAALRAFAVATVAWWKTKETEGFRPSAKIALRAPFDALGDALQVAVEAVDWKKHGVTTGIVIGATFTLLFGVLTAAELTDDLKPGSAPHLATTELAAPLAARPVAASNMAAMGMHPVPPPPVVTIAALEPDEVDPDPTLAKRAAKKQNAKANKLTFTNADVVFNP